MIDLTAPFASLVCTIDELLHGPLNPSRSNVNQRLVREGVWRGDDMQMLAGDAPLPRPPGEWITDAACRGHNQLFALPVGSIRMGKRRIAELAQPAKDICHNCNVIEPCQTWAMTTPDPAVDHVAGGLTPHERQQRRRETIGLHPL